MTNRQQRRADARAAAKQQRASRATSTEWEDAQRRAAAHHARDRARAIREGRLAEFDAAPWMPHPDDVRIHTARLLSVLYGEPPEAAAAALLEIAAGVLGMMSHDDAHFAAGIVEFGTTVETAAREFPRRETPFTRPALDKSKLGAGDTRYRVLSALEGATPTTSLECVTPVCGYAIGAAASDEADLQRRLARAMEDVEQQARRMFHLAQAFPGRRA